MYFNDFSEVALLITAANELVDAITIGHVSPDVWHYLESEKFPGYDVMKEVLDARREQTGFVVLYRNGAGARLYISDDWKVTDDWPK